MPVPPRPGQPLSATRRRLFCGATVALSLVISCLLLEVGSRLYLSRFEPEPFLSRWPFRATQPPPYQDCDYFSQEFLAESMRCFRADTPAGAHFFVPGDFPGRHIHVAGGRRVTTDQPTTCTGRVLLFGGSTVFGAEVPDRWTIASCLQRLLNEQVGERWQVENYGVCAMIARLPLPSRQRVRPCRAAEHRGPAARQRAQ